MHPNNKHTDKKLQELENQSLPDLSGMDKHWQEMKTLLQPGIAPSRPKNGITKKYFRWMIAAFFIVGLLLLTYLFVNNTNTRQKKATAGNEKLLHQPAKQPADTAPSFKVMMQKDPGTISPPKAIILKDSIRVIRSARLQLKDSMLESPPATRRLDQPVVEAKASLGNFFNQLEKQSQQFVINNKRDTAISGEDGTVLLIPANTFDSKDEVVITMKEFYSYEDIITNKLSTCSNGQQLITGGMVHITATVKGKEADIQPGKSIRWFIPDTTKAMNQMQLFTGSTARATRQLFREDGENLTDLSATNRDSTGMTGTPETINWIPQERYFSNTYLVKSVKVLDLINEPSKIRHTKKGDIGLFHISGKPKIGREELRAQLKEKYGYYKVKIKNPERNNFFRRIKFRFFERDNKNIYNEVGDSIWVGDDIARKYKLQATDSITSTRRNLNYISTGASYIKKIFPGINLDSLATRFSVDIRTLGWINCDRFNREGPPKIDFYVDLEDSAANYYTLLVFTNIRSMMTGNINGNKVVFSNIPEGEPAKVISVGIQNGKTVAAMETVQISKKILTNLKFKDTSPVVFRSAVKAFDN